MHFKVIIPARLNSTRLPGKPLAKIAGIPMIKHVYDKAVNSGAVKVVIATDSKEIADVAKDFGAHVCMTSSDHNTGTERIAEAAEALGYEKDDIIVNLQSDEPMMPPSIIHKAAYSLDIHDNAKVSTIATPIHDVKDVFNPAIVKVVMNKRGHAIYFSRAPIPWERENFSGETKTIGSVHYRHIGIYAYRVGFLQEYLKTVECEIEACEKLEQLRILWHGGRIYVSTTTEKLPIGVDTQEDLDLVRKKLES
ncbi:MAG: 3-deoxy-manno-octulosonate cytidylyltransferase [Pseudomonadota bacterium]|nr:3-deoxy-manno-octulosonate cytidylyltransferase [Pseudomonadota bacterium]